MEDAAVDVRRDEERAAREAGDGAAVADEPQVRRADVVDAEGEADADERQAVRDGEDARDHQQQVERAAEPPLLEELVQVGPQVHGQQQQRDEEREVVERPRRRQPGVRRAQHAGEAHHREPHRDPPPATPPQEGDVAALNDGESDDEPGAQHHIAPQEHKKQPQPPPGKRAPEDEAARLSIPDSLGFDAIPERASDSRVERNKGVLDEMAKGAPRPAEVPVLTVEDTLRRF